MLYSSTTFYQAWFCPRSFEFNCSRFNVILSQRWYMYHNMYVETGLHYRNTLNLGPLSEMPRHCYSFHIRLLLTVLKSAVQSLQAGRLTAFSPLLPSVCRVRKRRRYRGSSLNFTKTRQFKRLVELEEMAAEGALHLVKHAY